MFLIVSVFWVQSQKSRLCNYATGKLRVVALANIDIGLITTCGILSYEIRHTAHHGLLSPLWSATLAGVQQGFYSSALSLFSSVGFLISAYLFIQWRNSRHPDSVVVDDLVALLSSISDPSKSELVWTNLDVKRYYMEQLEEVAVCYERYFPAKLSCRNRTIMAWQEKMFVDIAAAVRDLMRWVVMPKIDTRKSLIERIVSLLSHTVTGDWDALERGELEPLPSAPSARIRLVAWFRIVVQAGLIPLGVYAFHLLQPKEHIPAFMFAIAVGWPVITVLTGLDPDIKSKLETLRSAIQIIPGSGEKKEGKG